MVLLVDIDNTLTRATPRFKKAGPPPPFAQTEAYMAWLEKLQPDDELEAEPPYEQMLKLLRAMDNHFYIVYLTSRSEIKRDVTEKWLRKHDFPHGTLHMRPTNLISSSGEFKKTKIKEICEAYNMHVIALDDDDEGSTEDYYKEYGVLHLKVMGDGR